MQIAQTERLKKIFRKRESKSRREIEIEDGVLTLITSTEKFVEGRVELSVEEGFKPKPTPRGHAATRHATAAEYFKIQKENKIRYSEIILDRTMVYPVYI
jgi:hypothetical protein